MKKRIILLLMISLGILSINNVQAESSYLDEKGNYYNPETKESFKWIENNQERSATVAKKFTFTVRYTLKSGNFKLNGTYAKIKINKAYIGNYNGKYLRDGNKHKYQVDLKNAHRWFSSNVANFTLPTDNKTVSLGGGFHKGESYYVKITNNDKLSGGEYVVGEGEVIAS